MILDTNDDGLHGAIGGRPQEEFPLAVDYWSHEGWKACVAWCKENLEHLPDDWVKQVSTEPDKLWKFSMYRRHTERFVIREGRDEWVGCYIRRENHDIDNSWEGRRQAIKSIMEIVHTHMEGPYDIFDVSGPYSKTTMIARFPSREAGVLLRLALPDVYTFDFLS